MRAYDRDPPNPHLPPPTRHPNGPSKAMTELSQKQHPQNPAHACADVKPRLTKEQHDILEAHFQQQHKPSTSTKKGFAESLGVPVDKINNWFQNRRAKVKQDIKKQMSQFNMNMNVYGANNSMPIVTSQFGHQNEQGHPQQNPQDFYPVNADISPAGLPVDSIEGPSAVEPLGPPMPLHQGYDMHMLRSIPEREGRASYNPDAVMQSFMAAAAGPYGNSGPVSIMPQDQSFQYDQTGIPQQYVGDQSFPISSSLINEPGSTDDLYGPLADLSSFEYPTLTSTSTSTTVQAVDGNGSISSEPSPFSGAHSTTTTQSSTGQNAMSSVTSVASLYSNWTEDPTSSTDITPANQREDPFDHPYGNLPQASISEHGLPLWGNGQQHPIGQHFHQADMYQHNNASAQAILSSPAQNESRQLSTSHSEFEPPITYPEEALSRRNSSTTALAKSMSTVGIQTRQPSTDGFKQPTQPSSIASRRQRRPAALDSSTLRSASYTSGMPVSPGSNQTRDVEHSLRRIRSVGVTNPGRVQKSAPGSAQRSPLNFTFAEAAASPKFARQASGFATVGPAGSLAPPTPLTPNEMVRFPYWQSNTVIRSHAPMPEHSSPESLNVSWSMEPSSAGLYSNTASPPTTPLDMGQLNQARFSNAPLYRDTPPQSAPATQQCFPRATFMPLPQQTTEFHPSYELAIAQPKPSHFRRPSLPDTGHVGLNESHMQFPVQPANIAGDLQLSYNYQYKEGAMNGFQKNFMASSSQESLPGQPSASMPEFFVHEYSPPQAAGRTSLPPRSLETQPKNYIFANQGPHDFR